MILRVAEVDGDPAGMTRRDRIVPDLAGQATSEL